MSKIVQNKSTSGSWKIAGTIEFLIIFWLLIFKRDNKFIYRFSVLVKDNFGPGFGRSGLFY